MEDFCFETEERKEEILRSIVNGTPDPAQFRDIDVIIGDYGILDLMDIIELTELGILILTPHQSLSIH